MKQIASFTIDHNKLLPGVYVSRKDRLGSEIITTFDLRMTRPNKWSKRYKGYENVKRDYGATAPNPFFVNIKQLNISL